MIELLNSYRIAKQDSEQAAKELGFAFGQAYETANREVSEFQLAEYDDFTLELRPTLQNLSSRFMGNSFFTDAFGYLLQWQETGNTWTIGLHNLPISDIEGSQVVLDETPFVKGFVEGFRDSRNASANGLVSSEI